jgi:hypothetical protein
LALTPMSVFVSSTVNPSGITLAFSLVVVAGAVARWVYGEKSRAAVVAMCVGAPGLLLVRRDSALWVAILIVALAPLAVGSADLGARTGLWLATAVIALGAWSTCGRSCITCAATPWASAARGGSRPNTGGIRR